MKIPHELDRRVHVTEEMVTNMLTMYQNGESLHSISHEFGVDHKTVKRYVMPGYRESESQKQKASKPWLDYYDRDKHRKQMRDHRHYKRKLELMGKLHA